MPIIIGLRKKPSLLSPPNQKTKPFSVRRDSSISHRLATPGIARLTGSLHRQKEGRISSLFFLLNNFKNDLHKSGVNQTGLIFEK
jgi:hypothetical protein